LGRARLDCSLKLHPNAYGKYAHGPLSCLAHESSSLCSFQGSEGRDFELSRSRLLFTGIAAASERESGLEGVPSKLSSAILRRLPSRPKPGWKRSKNPLAERERRVRSLNRSRRDPQLDLSHNWPANPWMLRHRLWST
jgi:hypothetical protein